MAPNSMHSLRSPRWPILNTLPATFDSPAPSARLYLLNAVLITLDASKPSGTTMADTVSEYHLASFAQRFDPNLQ